MAGRFLQKKIIGRITGVDFMERLCHEASKQALTVGFLGGREGVAKMTADCLCEKHPGLRVLFAGEEWPDGKMANNQWLTVNKKGTQRLSITNHQSLTISHIDLLFVAFGFPKQEEWIANNLSHIPVTCAMGVGGAFDYISGKVPRASKLLRSAGLEWAYRLVRQPWRLKRQLALPQFTLEVIKEKINH